MSKATGLLGKIVFGVVGFFFAAATIGAIIDPETDVETSTQSTSAQTQGAPQEVPAVAPAAQEVKAEPTPASTTSSSLSNDDYYTNSAGNPVHSPARSSSVPAGATARCSDGTYSFSQSRRGTCSHHGGVATWL